MNDQNRRKFTRIGGDFDVRIDLPDQPKASDEIDIGKIVDISASGLLIRYPKPINLGIVVQITFLTPSKLEIFKIDAKVKRVKNSQDNTKYEVGVEFININKEIEKLLDHYLTVDQE